MLYRHPMTLCTTCIILYRVINITMPIISLFRDSSFNSSYLSAHGIRWRMLRRTLNPRPTPRSNQAKGSTLTIESIVIQLYVGHHRLLYLLIIVKIPEGQETLLTPYITQVHAKLIRFQPLWIASNSPIISGFLTGKSQTPAGPRCAGF
jgi:hypothetical protein